MAPRNNQRSTPAQRPAPSRGASKAAVQAFVASNPNSRTAQAATAPAQSKPTSLGQVLRIAGGGRGIGGKELKNILDTGGKNVSGGQVVKRLDKINERLAANDMTGINLKSGAVNFLTRQAERQGPGMDNFLGLGKSTFGPGKIGQALQGMVGTRETGGYINPQSGKQSRTPGTARTILPRGMDLMPSGRQTVRGIGKQYEVPSRLMQSGTLAPVTGDGIAPEDISPTETPITAPEMLPEPPPEEEKAPQFGASLSEALANWATGFKTARSSRKRSGPRAQGLASQRVNPTGAFRGGM